MKYLIMIAMALVYFLPVPAQASSTADQIAAINKMEADTLARLYKENPDTQRQIKDAVGYAVFSSGELAVLWLSGGYGHGVAHDNRDGKDTYMEMAKAGVGLGLGAKEFNTVFVFHEPKAFHDFIATGLDLSGTADVAAKQDQKGKSLSGGADVLPGVRVYQLTDSGLLAEGMIQGNKYWRDDALNKESPGNGK
jgi:lipid-binding SYLF domain-containing protein